MKQQDKHFYEFGPFRIEQSERLLRRGTEVVSLPPKAVELLLALIERPGEAVDKDELLTLVWPGTFVEEGSLTQNVSLLRKVLGDRPTSPYIATIPRRGYRFVAPVTCVRIDHTTRRSLAVLPLVNLSHDQSQDFFADGMTDELISCLMKIDALRVASRTSVMAYKNTTKSLRQIAHELSVDWIVEGAVLHTGRRVRITAHLIDCATESQLWAETYEQDLSEILALQGEVARDIAGRIRVNVTAPEQSSMARSRPVDPEAYDAYLRGRYFWNKRGRDDLKRANAYFRSAIDSDPTYAPALAGLADTYALLSTIGFDVMPPREAMPRARAAAVRALEIDDTMCQAHASLGYVKLSYEWDWTGAEEQFKRSIACNQAYAVGHHWYGHCLFALGRLEDAAREMRCALELDPLSVPCNLGVGWSLYYARDYDGAIEQFRKTLEIAPNLPMVLYELGLAYQNKGSYDEALATFQKAYALSEGEPAAVMLLGHMYALIGRHTEARQEIARLEEMARQKYVPALYTAFVYAGERDANQAFVWFEKAYEERSNYLIYLAVEPSLDGLRSDSRYTALMRRVGVA
jgi:TolB-like protein/Flp pilus assembly protein TadD